MINHGVILAYEGGHRGVIGTSDGVIWTFAAVLNDPVIYLLRGVISCPRCAVGGSYGGVI